MHLHPSEPAPDPSAPTTAPAGSAEKIRVLVARAAAGLELFHPQDATGALWRSCGLQAFMDKYATAAGKGACHERRKARQRAYQRRKARGRKAAGR
jgi:hypothetical protein